MGFSRSKALISIAATLVVVYFVLLLGTTFYSQRQLTDAAHQSVHFAIQKRVSALSYFYSERRADISRLSQETAITVFFSNRALGMSMEYGLRTSLMGMRELARAMVSTRLMEGGPIYRRVVIQDMAGEILVDTGRDAGGPAFWGDPKLMESAPAGRSGEPELLVGAGLAQEIYLRATVSHRETPVAIIVAQVDHAAVVDRLVQQRGEAGDYVVEVRSGADAAALNRPGHSFLEPVPETPFQMVYLGSTRRIGGLLASSAYFYALAFLAVGLLTLLGVMLWQIQERERALIASHDELAEANAQLRRSQKQLIQSEKMASLGTLAAGVAHEINNPIGFIQSNLTNLAEYQEVLRPLVEDYRALVHARSETEPELCERWQSRLRGEDIDFLLEDLESLVADSLEGSRRVTTIVAGLRGFAHGRESTDEPVDVNGCVRSALVIANNEIKYKADVEVQLGEVPSAYGSPVEITQVLVNLLVNAAQAIAGHGTIGVETQVLDDSILIQVSDSGSGIDPEHLDQVFTPFFTTKPVGSGTGLGLSISHGIAERHGGSLQVESELGKGSVFTLILPAAGSGGGEVKQELL